MCTNLFGMIFFQPVEILNLETFHLSKSGFGSKRNAIARLAVSSAVLRRARWRCGGRDGGVAAGTQRRRW